MVADSNIKKGAVVLFTDSFNHSVNGISVFSHFFVADELLHWFEQVVVFETSTRQLFRIKTGDAPLPVTHIYVNANFSQSDFLVRGGEWKQPLIAAGLSINEAVKKTMISHGWPRIRFRYTYYNLYYRLRYSGRAKDLARLRFYDEVLFISKAKDNCRHLDYVYATGQGLPVSFYDFSARFIAKKSAHVKATAAAPTVERAPYILVVSNFQQVKNLWWLLLYNARRKLSRRRMKPFVLLVEPVNSPGYSLFKKLSKRFSTELVHDQEAKMALLQQASFLFIPSYSEYNPIVALEARACNKKVVSLYKVTALEHTDYYHSLNEY
jgi:glycosyltransferase involved in cell wall biosynthesis